MDRNWIPKQGETKINKSGNCVKLLLSFLSLQTNPHSNRHAEWALSEYEKRIINVEALFAFSVTPGKSLFKPVKYFVQHTRLFLK